MSEIDWDSLDEEFSKSGSGKVNFYRFEDGSVIVCRPVAGGKEFVKLWPPDGEVAVVIVDKKDGPAAAQILSEHVGRPIEPQKRFAMNVIDRADGQLKVM